MEKIFTIGSTHTSLEEFIERLKDAQVDCVVDIRLNNTSQLAGFAKRDDLDYLLTRGFNIGYVHLLECAPTQDMLDPYRHAHDWNRYSSDYKVIMKERDMVRVFTETVKKNGWKRPCLLCAEYKPDTCHRILLAEAVSEAEGVEVKHL